MKDIITETITVKGLADIEKSLMALPDKLARYVLVQAFQAGAKVLKKEAQENVHDSDFAHVLKSKFTGKSVLIQPGNFRKNIKIKIDKTKSRGFALTYEVFVKNKDTWYWRFVEFGTSRIVAKSPIRNAFEASRGKIIEAIANNARKRFSELEKK